MQLLIAFSAYSARKRRMENCEFLNGIVQVSFNSEAEYNRKAGKLLMEQLKLSAVLKKILKEYW